DAVADVDDFGFNIGFGLLRLIVGDILVEGLEVDFLALRGYETKTRVGAGRDADHGNLLQVGTVVARGLQAIERKLGGDVFGGNVAAALAGASSLKQIVGEEADMGLDAVGTNALQCGDGGRGKVRAEARFSARFRRLLLRRESGDQQQPNREYGSAHQHAEHLIQNTS